MIIIDDFVKDYSLLDEIENDPTFFSQNGQYMWWEGWWSSPANSLKKRLIQYIWGENSPMSPILIGGFEYWTNQFGPDLNNPKLDTHFDKDEYLWETEKILSQPMIGTVFYPIGCDIDGGYLEIESEGTLVERIKPEKNRLVIFPAGRYPHRVTEVSRGIRSAIAINLWYDAPKGLDAGKLILENSK